ncbi:hypothetical protein ACQP1V_36200 [Microtetraspora malaysiensis]|uniref:hypothetical protein n=1 Tax=Microtetraspora malaysiensis TaxID=161358 RepID=UPI003D90C0FF
MTEILAACVALATLAGGGTVVVTVIRFLKRLSDDLDDWRGEQERPGVPERPGVMKRLASIETRQGTIEAQLHPNGGSSLRDAVNRTDKRSERLEQLLEEHLADHLKQSPKEG